MNDIVYVYDSKQLMFLIKSWTAELSKITGTPTFSIHFKTCHAYKHDMEWLACIFYPMLPVSLNGPFVIAPRAFSNTPIYKHIVMSK
jgi:hypothetical protein